VIHYLFAQIVASLSPTVFFTNVSAVLQSIVFNVTILKTANHALSVVWGRVS